MKLLWLVTTGDGGPGNEWDVKSIHATAEGAAAAKSAYETPRLRNDGSTYIFEASVEEWPLLD